METGKRKRGRKSEKSEVRSIIVVVRRDISGGGQRVWITRLARGNRSGRRFLAQRSDDTLVLVFS